MRILIDATTAREGGTVTYLRSMLPALLRHGGQHRYDLLLSSVYQEELINELPEGISLISQRLPVNPLLRFMYLQVLVPRLLRDRRIDLLFSVSEVSVAFTSRPRIVMVHNSNIYAPLKTFPGLAQRWQLTRYRITRQPLAYLTMMRANRLIFVSETFRRLLTSRVLISPEKSRVIYHGVNPRFNTADCVADTDSITGARPYVLTVLSISHHKNIETLLSAFSKLVIKMAGSGAAEGLQLMVAGPTVEHSLYRSLVSLAHGLGIDARVHFLGRVDIDRLAALYRGAALFVLPSRLESFGLPLVEAMACGAPVIASDLPICREICEDAALYFPPDDPDNLALRMQSTLEDKEQAEGMSRRGSRRVADFSWDTAAVKLVDQFEEVMRERRG